MSTDTTPDLSHGDMHGSESSAGASVAGALAWLRTCCNARMTQLHRRSSMIPYALFITLTALGCSSTASGPDTGASALDGASRIDGANTLDSALALDGGRVVSHAPIDLGQAGHYAILAKSGISTVPTSAITGDVALSPAAATFLTGFSLSIDATNAFATSTQVTGHLFAADYAVPTPAALTTAVGDMELAYTEAAGRAPDVTELGAGEIGGMTLVPGVYAWGTGVSIATDVVLSGNATDVWIFQIAQGLTMASGARVTLAGGALPRNVFWQVAGAVDLGTTAHAEGTILAHTSITLRTGASVAGRLLAQTAVDIDSSTIVAPAP
jgi:hypothetical protein